MAYGRRTLAPEQQRVASVRPYVAVLQRSYLYGCTNARVERGRASQYCTQSHKINVPFVLPSPPVRTRIGACAVHLLHLPISAHSCGQYRQFVAVLYTATPFVRISRVLLSVMSDSYRDTNIYSPEHVSHRITKVVVLLNSVVLALVRAARPQAPWYTNTYYYGVAGR